MSEQPDTNLGSHSEPAIAPSVTIHPDRGYEVKEHYKCPLEGLDIFTIAGAEHSALEGCPFCIVRYTAVKELCPHSTGTECIAADHDSLFSPMTILMEKRENIVLACADDKGMNTPCWDFYGPRIWEKDRLQRLPQYDTSSERCFERAVGWLEECDREHNCTSTKERGVPCRVLDVRNGRVRLLGVQGDEHFNYACLSHCWGSSEDMLRMTSINKSAFETEIPWHLLPQTFRDAIQFVRRLDQRLNVPFLWIDALCIAQDSEVDWQRESANMASIYRNAYVTLAATASRDASGGCFKSSLGSDTAQFEFSAPLAVVGTSDNTVHPIRARKTLDHRTASFPLLQRGWVFQERVLSPRMLHFAAGELIWECSVHSDCECASPELRRQFKPPGKSIYLDDADHYWSPDRHLWRELITDYTKLSLTYPRDAFPALSGIAKMIASRLNDEYIAGSWKTNLISDLAWYFTAEAGKLCEPAKPWRAPSWSWASVKWRTHLDFLHISRELASVEELSCHTAGLDPTGEMTDGALTLRAKVLPVRIEATAEYGMPENTIRVVSTDFTIRGSPPRYTHRITDMWTCFYGLAEFNNPDAMLVQLGSLPHKREVNFYGVYPPLCLAQESRTFLLLGTNGVAGWRRIGLMSITTYNPHLALYGIDGDSVSIEWQQQKLAQLKWDEIVDMLEVGAKRSRAIFRLFDEAEAQSITVT